MRNLPDEQIVLCLNAGSTTVKTAAFSAADRERPPAFRVTLSLGNGLNAVFDRMKQNPVAVVHRVVHSGPSLRGPLHVTERVLDELRSVSSLAPLHQIAALDLIEAASRRFPAARQIACFDTDFFADLPERGSRMPVAAELRVQGVRRYGFHGLAYASILRVRPDLKSGRVVLCHLGGGCSLAAVAGGRPIATSMGMTPTGGIPMAGRSGDLDPGVVLWSISTGRFSPEELTDLLNRRSGLYGLSGTSGDISELLSDGGPDSCLAVSIYCDAIAEHVAGFAVRLGGLDHLSFSGGVGENQPAVRDTVVAKLRSVGLLHSSRFSVTPCDEEWEMACQTTERFGPVAETSERTIPARPAEPIVAPS